MKNECSIVKDLLPLYVEDMLSSDTSEFVENHVKTCEMCRTELESLKEGSFESAMEVAPATEEAKTKAFKKVMKRMNAQFHSFAYLLIIFCLFLGFSWTISENMMNNIFIMSVVGIFGYYVFRWKAIYKIPALVAVVDLFVFGFKIIEIDLYSSIVWSLIYCVIAAVGVAIAFLLHFAFRKEKK